MTDLAGNIAIVSGASKGMGRHFVRALVAEGVKVAALARPSPELDSLAAECGAAVLVIPCDVSSPAEVNAAVARTVEAFGRLDILVNNAAVFIVSPFEESSDELIRQHVEVNILGVAWLIRAAIPHLRKSAGQIVSISSESVQRPCPMLSLYAGTKAAVETLSDGLREELRSDGIRVGLLRSGNVAGGSGGQSWSKENTEKFFAKLVETGFAAMTGEPAQPEDMARALIAFLSVPRALSVDMVQVRSALAGVPDGAKGIIA